MKKILNRSVVVLLFVWLNMIAITPCGAVDDYIDISQYFINKIPMAIPAFKPLSGDPMEKEFADAGADMLTTALDFTGYFKMLEPPRSFIYSPDNFDITGAYTVFKDWTHIGAELLITGGVLVKGDLVVLDLRLFDSVKGKLLIGKRYTGNKATDQWKNNLKKVILRFCGEVIKQITGQWGIFSTKIAFVSTGSGNKEIFTCDFDGSNTEQFTFDKSITLFPDWSPDGSAIAYTSYRTGKPTIYVKKRGSQAMRQIIAKDGINITPAWQPGKDSILAATLSFQGDQEIYLLTDKGKIIKRLTRSWGIDTSPTWSPDGKRLAFVSNRSGSPQIYHMEIESGRVERLTFEGKYNTQPVWSPKGDKIVYSSMEKEEINICTIGFNGKGPTKLTSNKGKNESPSWAPDGSMIVFSSTREGPTRLYVMTAAGSEQRRLLSLPGDQMNPKWSPRLANF